MRRVMVGAIILTALAFSAISVAAQQPAPQAQPSAMVQVFVAKGYLTPEEAARIAQAPNQAEANDRLLKVFLAKGLLTQDEFNAASGAAVAPAAENSANEARMLNAEPQVEAHSEDPRAFLQAVFRDGLLPALRTSPIVFRAFLRWFNLLVTPEALMADPEIVNEVLAAYQDREHRPAGPVLGPDRATLLHELA